MQGYLSYTNALSCGKDGGKGDSGGIPIQPCYKINLNALPSATSCKSLIDSSLLSLDLLPFLLHTDVRTEPTVI